MEDIYYIGFSKHLSKDEVLNNDNQFLEKIDLYKMGIEFIKEIPDVLGVFKSGDIDTSLKYRDIYDIVHDFITEYDNSSIENYEIRKELFIDNFIIIKQYDKNVFDILDDFEINHMFKIYYSLYSDQRNTSVDDYYKMYNNYFDNPSFSNDENLLNNYDVSTDDIENVFTAIKTLTKNQRYCEVELYSYYNDFKFTIEKDIMSKEYNLLEEYIYYNLVNNYDINLRITIPIEQYYKGRSFKMVYGIKVLIHQGKMNIYNLNEKEIYEFCTNSDFLTEDIDIWSIYSSVDGKTLCGFELV